MGRDDVDRGHRLAEIGKGVELAQRALAVAGLVHNVDGELGKLSSESRVPRIRQAPGRSGARLADRGRRRAGRRLVLTAHGLRDLDLARREPKPRTLDGGVG
ncbi:MAG: hypothetical protein IPK81_14110 [Rhodospirillales bacterium]|nr:MAG: hypothetical protein IPK81_14110 [Rhodospirillales bacterium]